MISRQLSLVVSGVPTAAIGALRAGTKVRNRIIDHYKTKDLVNQIAQDTKAQVVSTEELNNLQSKFLGVSHPRMGATVVRHNLRSGQTALTFYDPHRGNNPIGIALQEKNNTYRPVVWRDHHNTLRRYGSMKTWGLFGDNPEFTLRSNGHIAKTINTLNYGRLPHVQAQAAQKELMNTRIRQFAPGVGQQLAGFKDESIPGAFAWRKFDERGK